MSAILEGETSRKWGHSRFRLKDHPQTNGVWRHDYMHLCDHDCQEQKEKGTSFMQLCVRSFVTVHGSNSMKSRGFCKAEGRFEPQNAHLRSQTP
jgi:hypothetical protein